MARRAADHTIRSNEYTPLLEDFTERFITRSQIVQSGDNTEQVESVLTALSNQLSVPTPLLLIHHQQSPFNPNLVTSDISSSCSTSSLLSLQDPNGSLTESIQQDSFNRNRNSCLRKNPCYIKIKKIGWYFFQVVLITSLMNLNLGSILVQPLYSSFLAASIKFENGTFPVLEGFLVEIAIVSLIQLSMTILAFISSLILLYAAWKILYRLRKRIQLNLKYSIEYGQWNHFGSEPITILTYEKIVYETLGSLSSKILSIIMTIHQLCLSTLYIHLIYDFFDMLIISFQWLNLTNLLSPDKWYMNHVLLTSTWLTVILLIIYGFGFLYQKTNCQPSITRLYLLRLLKILTIFIGLISLIFIISSTIILSRNEKDSIFKCKNRNIVEEVPKKINWSDWLLDRLPLLLLPFHLNEMLITLLFSQFNKSYYKKFKTIQQQQQQDEATGLIEEEQTKRKENPLYYLSSLQSIRSSSTTHFFFKSFRKIRNWFILVISIVYLTNLCLNFVYIKFFPTNPFKFEIEFNFIRYYFEQCFSDNTRWNTIFISLACIILILKSTTFYLLLIFRGKLALDWLICYSKTNQENTNLIEFMTTYIVLNCVSLIAALTIYFLPWLINLLIWILQLSTIVLVLIYPLMLLNYFTSNRTTVILVGGESNQQQQQQYHHQQQQQQQQNARDWTIQFKPIKCRKFLWLFSLITLSMSSFYLIFWLYKHFCFIFYRNVIFFK